MQHILLTLIFMVSIFTSTLTDSWSKEKIKYTEDIVQVSALEQDLALKLIGSTVRVRTEQGKGSGVVVWSGISENDKRVKITYILTNNHVVEDIRDVIIDRFLYLKDRNTIGVSSYEAVVVFTSSDADLALIEIQTSPDVEFAVVELLSKDAWDALKLYEQVYLVSCGLGNPPYITNGNLANVDKHESQFMFTASTIFGSSGGGVYTKEGRLIGLVCAVQIARMDGFLFPVPHKAVGITLITILSTFTATDYDFVFGLKKPSINKDDEEEDSLKEFDLDELFDELLKDRKKWY